MKIKYKGDPRQYIAGSDFDRKAANDPDYVELYGMRFEKDKLVSVPDDSHFAEEYGAKFRGNNHFEVKD